jgi:hypothetical protein
MQQSTELTIPDELPENSEVWRFLFCFFKKKQKEPQLKKLQSTANNVKNKI